MTEAEYQKQANDRAQALRRYERLALLITSCIKANPIFYKKSQPDKWCDELLELSHQYGFGKE